MKALWKYLLVLCVGLATPLFITVPAAAEDDAAVDMARQRFKEGVEFFDKKQYDKARAAFLQAYALKAHPAVLLNLAQSELRSDREAEAATHFAQYLREHSEATEDQRQAAVDGLAAAKEKVGEVKLDVSQAGADISVDGEEVGKSPLPDPLYLAPGSYTITASKGDATARVSVQVTAGDSKTESLTFEPESAEPAGAPGPADEEAAPSDEEEDEEAAEEEDEDASAEYYADGDGFFAWYQNRPLAWVGTGLFVAGAGFGVISALTAQNYNDSASEVSAQINDAATRDMVPTRGICVTLPSPTMYPTIDADRQRQYYEACKKYERNVDQADTWERNAALGFVVAGVALAGTITYYVLDGVVYADSASGKPRQRVGTRPLLLPYVGPGQGGLSVVGQF